MSKVRSETVSTEKWKVYLLPGLPFVLLALAIKLARFYVYEETKLLAYIQI
jgi:hypothetical protein